jgi:hypothetical protein
VSSIHSRSQANEISSAWLQSTIFPVPDTEEIELRNIEFYSLVSVPERTCIRCRLSFQILKEC